MVRPENRIVPSTIGARIGAAVITSPLRTTASACPTLFCVALAQSVLAHAIQPDRDRQACSLVLDEGDSTRC